MKPVVSLKSLFLAVLAIGLLLSTGMAERRLRQNRKAIADLDQAFWSEWVSGSYFVQNRTVAEVNGYLQARVERFRVYHRQYDESLSRLPEYNRLLSDFGDADKNWPLVKSCPLPQALDQNALRAWRIFVPPGLKGELKLRCFARRLPDSDDVAAWPASWHLTPGNESGTVLAGGTFYVIVARSPVSRDQSAPKDGFRVSLIEETFDDGSFAAPAILMQLECAGLGRKFPFDRLPNYDRGSGEVVVCGPGRTEFEKVVPFFSQAPQPAPPSAVVRLAIEIDAAGLSELPQ